METKYGSNIHLRISNLSILPPPTVAVIQFSVDGEGNDK